MFHESKCPDETVHVQDDVNLRILLMFEGIFSLDMAYYFMVRAFYPYAAHVNSMRKSTEFLFLFTCISGI